MGTATPHRMTLGYARVSTIARDEALQVDALQATVSDRIFIDKDSGRLSERPALGQLLA